MSSQVSSSPRQGLNARQSETVERLIAAGAELLEERGPEEVTVRAVAHRAGVSPATAYTYLASKNHLFAEVFWRRLVTDPAPEPTGADPVARVRAVTRHLTDLLAGSPHLAAAANLALLGTDPEVARLRLRIGAEFVRRFEEAAAGAGGPADPRQVDALTLAFTGALLQAGMGLVAYADLAHRLDDVAAVVLG